jgi:transposase
MPTEPFPGPASREWRRKQALRLKQLSWKQRDLATALSASESAVSAWLAAAAQRGPNALCSRASPGRPARLSDTQLRLLPDFLWHGAEACDFRGEVWTCGRVAQVIEEEFGVRYNKGHVSRLLKALGWTPQVPITRAVQRDEEAIERWQPSVTPKNPPFQSLHRAGRPPRGSPQKSVSSGTSHNARNSHNDPVTGRRRRPSCSARRKRMVGALPPRQ